MSPTFGTASGGSFSLAVALCARRNARCLVSFLALVFTHSFHVNWLIPPVPKKDSRSIVRRFRLPLLESSLFDASLARTRLFRRHVPVLLRFLDLLANLPPRRSSSPFSETIRRALLRVPRRNLLPPCEHASVDL